MDNETRDVKVVQSVNAEALIARAIEKDVPIEALEKLLAMRRELKAEQGREAFFYDLARFQKWCPIIDKQKIVYGKDGKTVRYRYAPLDVIVKRVHRKLEEFGFSYTIKTKQNKTTVKSIVEAHHKAGHFEVTEFAVPIDPEAYMSDQQKIASALTYSKKYAFCNAFGILTGDQDLDGNGKPDDAPKQKVDEKKTEGKEPSAAETLEQLGAIRREIRKILSVNMDDKGGPYSARAAEYLYEESKKLFKAKDLDGLLRQKMTIDKTVKAFWDKKKIEGGQNG